MGGQAQRRPPGRVGPYRLDRRLGAGGMGVVYLGYDDAGTTVAIKLIRPEYVAEPEFRARLRREVDAAQRVPRFCTAPVLAADLDADPPWVATEYIDAPTLDVTLLEEGRLDGAELESFAAGVAAALRAIHEHGVVHRDLKPSNILLSPLGPRVIDFGIARVADATELTRLTETGVVVGTPAYMAPEQLRNEPLSTAVDVFAWAALVTVAATGRGPFGAGAGAMHAILHEQPDLGELAEPLRGLVAAALAKDPADRPSAAELVERLSESTSATTSQVLAQAADGPTLASVHSAPTELASPAESALPPAGSGLPPAEAELRAVRRRRRMTAVAATAAAVAVAVVIGSAFWWFPRDLPAGGLIPGLAGNGSSGVTGSHPGPGAGSSSGERRSAAQNPDPAAEEVHPAQIGRPLTGHMDVIESVAIGELDGTPIAVSGARWDSIHVWDLASRERIGEPLRTGVADDYRCVAVSQVDGRPVVVSGGVRPMRLWDLTEQQLQQPFSYGSNVSSLAAGELDGTPLAVSGGWDNSIRVWDLATGEQVGDAYQPLTASLGPTTSLVVALGEAGGSPVVAAGGRYYREAWVWDLATGEQVSAFSTDYLASLAVGELAGSAVLVSGGVADATIRVWDLATGEPIGEPFTGHTSGSVRVALGELAGRRVVVSGAADRTVRVWDLATGEQVGQPLTGHTGAITSVAVGELDGRPIAVSGSTDRTVRIWDLTLADGAG